MTAAQLAECLEYSDKTVMDKLISRNEYIKTDEFSSTVKMTVPRGNSFTTQNTRVFTEDGIYEITMLSKQPKARQFRSWIRTILKSLRKGDMVLVNQNAVISPELIEMSIEKIFDNKMFPFVEKTISDNISKITSDVTKAVKNSLPHTLHFG